MATDVSRAAKWAKRLAVVTLVCAGVIVMVAGCATPKDEAKQSQAGVDTVSDEWVVYKGVRMVKGWPEKIEAAQLQPTITIKGVERRRIRYGEEADDWGADRQSCHDCGVVKGQIHVLGCDVERCPVCAGQLISCECDD